MQNFSHATLLTVLAFGLAFNAPAAEKAAKASPQEIEAATRLQVFLDRANFGPGKIDGRYGGFTQKALVLYREAHGLPPVTAGVSSEEASPTDKVNGDADSKAKTERKAQNDGNAAPKENAQADDSKTHNEEPKPKAERTLALPDLGDMDLNSVGAVFVDYQVTENDQSAVGEMPKEVPAMAEVKWLPYATLGEMVAEKFHCDIDFLKELNPGKVEGLQPGDTVKVPNVEPFDVAAVKELPLLDQLAMNREDAEKANDADDKDGKKETAKAKDKNNGKEKEQDSDNEANARGKDKDVNLSSSKAPEAYRASSDQAAGAAPADAPVIPKASQIAVEVHTKDNMLRLLENGKLVAAYPVTIGSDETKSPQGEWKVRGIARLPDFRYDSSFLKTGERGDKTYLLPPGPNNLVGVVWIALNRRGIGLHGTGEPDSIGRSASHGCVRLANWDIVRLATRVRGGVAVTID